MNKKYTLNYTGKFKKDLKLCEKEDTIFPYSKKYPNFLKRPELSLQNIVHTNKLANTKACGNVIFNRTGCWYGTKTIQN